MKKVLSIILSLAMLLSIAAGLDFSALALAEDEIFTSGDYNYYIQNDETAKIIKYNGSDVNVNIPSTLDGKAVTCIGFDAFEDCTSLKNITIPDSVTSIDDSAFPGCTGLKSVNIPKNVSRIGNNPFSGCSNLESITVDENNEYYDSRNNCNSIISTKDIVETYEDGEEYTIEKANTLVAGCKNTAVLNSITIIGNSAFSGCTGLTSVTIPDSVTSIGWNAFYGCTGLTSVTIPNSVTRIGASVFSGCTSLTSITIPDSVRSIGDSAFFGCTGLTSITIPDSVTSIGYYVFWGCKGLKNITIPNSVTSIGGSAFYRCSGLKSVTIPNSVTIRGYKPFLDCYMTKENFINNSYISDEDWEVEIVDSDTNDLCIKDNVLIKARPYVSGDVTIPDGVTSIGDSAFEGCTGLTSVTIPDSVTNIGYEAFDRCSGLTKITVDSNNKYYDSRNNCNAIIETKDNLLIWGCKNTIIPDGVTSIGSSVFEDCTDLTNISIPNTVTSIYYGAFEGCTGLTDVYYSGTEDEWNKIDIAYGNGSLKNAKIHYLGKGNPEEPSTKPETPGTPSKPAAKPAPKASNAKSAAKPANNISAQIKTFSNISVKLKKVKKGKKSFTVQWKKAAGVDGYQVQYSLKKNMKKSKTKTVKASKSKLTVKKLKKGKKYYVRIRTYKTINGKKVYGKWSAKKTVKVK